jgi:tRNA (Thr-GGU) A37 N-methylase
MLSCFGHWLEVQDLKAIDGTPIIDVKPVLEHSEEAQFLTARWADCRN